MLRASWALISFPFVPGARSRLDRPLPALFPSSVRLWRQDRHFASSPRFLGAKGPLSVSHLEATPEVATDDPAKKPENEPDAFTPSADTSPSFRLPPFPLATAEDLEPKSKILAETTDTNIFEPATVEYRASERVLHPAVEIQGSTSLEETPEMASGKNKAVQMPVDESSQISVDESDLTPGFRFPPFPLTTVEELEPELKISAEPERASDTNIFEPPTLEYSAYQRLSQPSLDILTQVAQSLPERLPEPELESGSIFEDESLDDYASISTSTSPALPFTSTQALEMLVADRNFDEALRVLNMLLELGTQIPPSFAYESAAIAAVTTPASTAAEMDDQIETFRKWLSLIPLANKSRPRRFRRLRNRIILSPFHSLRLIMEFGLILAEKGHARSTHHSVITFICMYGDPDVTLRYIDELRARNRMFLEQSSQLAEVDRLDTKLRVDIVGLAVRTLANAGRFDHAVQLIPDPTETDFHLTPYTYHYLVHRMKETGDPRYVPHINFVTQHKSEGRHRSTGLKKMEKPNLALAIRCLANVGRFDLVVGLLPKLQEAEVALVADTFDFVLARLRESEGDYSTYSDLVTQLRDTTEVTPSMMEPSSERTQPALGKNEYYLAIAALTKAWCIEESLALIPAYHRCNTKYHRTLYNVVLWKLKICYNPKYERYIRQVQELKENTVKLAEQARARWLARRTARLDDFPGEDILLASSLSPSTPQRVGSNLAKSLRALRKALRHYLPSRPPHPLTIVRFLEVYLASGRTRAIPLLRNLALRRHGDYHRSYVFAEMLFHARRRKPDLVIQTFVTHFFIVGIPRDELLFQLRATDTERNPATDAVWAAAPEMKLFPSPMHVAVAWRALLELTHDERAIESLYAKLLRFADPSAPQAPVLHPGVPQLRPPPAWKNAVDASAFTPFVRRMCQALGTERGGQILKDMLRVGIQPGIYQLTELAMEYSRIGDVRRTFIVLDQVENAAKVLESTDATEGDDADDEEAAQKRRALQDNLPQLDQVFYIAVVRGFIMSKCIVQARQVEQRMYKRYGYVPGVNQYVDELYEDLQAAEKGEVVAPREPLTSVVHNSRYQALLYQHEPASNSSLEPSASV